MSLKNPNKDAVYDIFCEFLEVVIHNLIHARNLYPDCIFAKRKKYGVTVYQSLHPELNEYIKQALTAVRFHAKAHQLDKIYLCVFDTHFTTTYEQFVFDFFDLKDDFTDDPIYLKLEQNLRDFCLKLHNACGCLEDLPEEATFKILLRISETSNLDLNDDPAFDGFPWVCFDAESVQIKAPDIVPLHTVKTSCMNMQIYAERNSD